ncbi:MAG: ABC transporter permease [Butyrivibrio sp.]|nr:ABC transporter permease [Butyrivibrio sp.]
MRAFGEYIKSAVASIRNNKGRSFLTMLGIIIGIASVLAILSVGDGMKAEVNSEVNDLGSGGITISVDSKKTDKLITTEDIETVRDMVPQIKGIDITNQIWGTVSSRRGDYEAVVYGGTEARRFSYGNSDFMLHGRYFSAEDVAEARGAIVLSAYGARDLFGTTDVVGQTVTVSTSWMSAEATICGVREANATDDIYASYWGDDPLVIIDAPYTWLTGAFYLSDEGFTSISIYADADNRDDCAAQARNVLESHMGLRGENAVKIESYVSNMDSISGIMDVVTLVVALIAAISLIVGGIGVMNIMTVTVTERTREIGIRKALGARTSYILIQFLAESAILTLMGGLIGVVLGLVGGYVICRYAEFPFVINPATILLVVSIASAVGLFFGIYPARRAAKLDPIEALRAE